MRRLPAVGIAAVVVLAGAALPPPASAEPLTQRIAEDFSAYGNTAPLDDGVRFGPWRVVFDGRQKRAGVRVGNGALRLKPRVARSPGRTFAALVVSRERFAAEALHVSATWVTRAHTRIGKPNPWEVGWLVWDYEDNDHFTYLALKPNGWEVGRRDPAFPGGQRFIADASSPATPLGVLRTATVDRTGTATTVRVDGTVLASFDVGAGETTGAVGMYCEDSMVDWLHIGVATGTATVEPTGGAFRPGRLDVLWHPLRSTEHSEDT